MHEAIEWTEKSNGILMAKFPDSLPTHSKVQEFHFDTETGLLLQHHYTADIISPFAKAANRITSHAKNNAFVYPNSRIVTPRSTKGTALNSPVLIDIKVHQLNINSRLP